ncbi:cytochrome C peroxidase [Gluconobacter japonicus]|uniref:Cytochrome C peroxidase n=1 Tax=Gluconobacter japonicus TaxID=376620 RepID=A0A9Q2FL66_GLUJA|nr:cytochrome c peroxidase [Gluconobacter japonicus]KXV40337.1 cytochrome C peroxidase [Gluconobacter japonicus]MBF0870878.1 cytochrome C peroxidase [Gluconobacter japonicus]
MRISGLFLLVVTVSWLPAMACATSLSPERAETELGHRLFYDADLSLDGSMSCATCHEQRHAFSDGNPTHPGVTDERGIRNVPSLANVGLFHSLTWTDQHVTSLEKQIFIPLSGNHPVEMGMTDMAELSRRLSTNPCYRALFSIAFPESAMDMRHFSMALAAFERTLVSDHAVWDQPDHKETSEQKHGEMLFFGKGKCSVCHKPPLFMDQHFYVLGKLKGGPIRTPSLRNVEVTAPYLHDGSAATLAAAIRAHPNTDVLSDTEIASITAFLSLLTDQTFLSRQDFALPAEQCPVRIAQ